MPAIPAWLIVDARHRRKYPMGTIPPGITPKSALESGFLTRASTLDELAGKIGVDPRALRATVERLNGFAQSGVNEDFNRGATAYDRFYGDPSKTPLQPRHHREGAVLRRQGLAGDLGTKGGLLTDEHARVVGEDGSPIAGLYAAGNTTASVMGAPTPAQVRPSGPRRRSRTSRRGTQPR